MARNPNKVGVWQSLRNAWKVQDIRKKLVYTFLMLVVFRLVGVIPAPGVDYARVQASMGSNTLPLLDLVNMMTGSNFQNMTIMAMGITPYINSSIIMQLLTIARAMLTDPAILVLDEATSSVDTRTEIAIQKAMDHLMEGRTSFVIAHRLSTIKRADQIMCICNKGIAERGTHEELMQKKGIYYELNMSQYRALIQQQ